MIRIKSFPREQRYIRMTKEGKAKYMVGAIHTRNIRLPKFIWDRLK